jgi:hypothetical protein
LHDKSSSSRLGGQSKQFSEKGTVWGIGNSSTIVARDTRHDIEAQRSWKDTESAQSDMELKDISRCGSEEYLVEKGQFETKPLPLKINVTTIYALTGDERIQSSKDGGDVEDEDDGKIVGQATSNPCRGRTKNWPRVGETTTHISGGKSNDEVGGANKASRILGTNQSS